MSRIKWDKQHVDCKHYNSERCPIDAICKGCYHYKKDVLICSNCDRIMPNEQFRKKNGCKWCIK